MQGFTSTRQLTRVLPAQIQTNTHPKTCPGFLVLDPGPWRPSAKKKQTDSKTILADLNPAQPDKSSPLKGTVASGSQTLQRSFHGASQAPCTPAIKYWQLRQHSWALAWFLDRARHSQVLLARACCPSCKAEIQSMGRKIPKKKKLM